VRILPSGGVKKHVQCITFAPLEKGENIH